MIFYTNVQRYGKNLLYRGYQNGRRIQKRVPFKPTLFVPTQKPTVYNSIYGDPVEAVSFEGMRDARDFISMYENVENFDVYGTTDYVAQYIQEEWPDDISFDPDAIVINNYDIEVHSPDGFPYPDKAEHIVNSIAAKSTADDNYYVWSLYNYNPDLTELDGLRGKIIHEQFDSEIDLLSAFLTWHCSKKFSPDVLTGWNIRGFDVPYLVNRLRKIMGDDKAKLMSPWGMIQEENIEVKGMKMQTYVLKGISQLDMMDVFKKFGTYVYGPQESYSLNHISFVVLDEAKLSYDEYTGLFDLAERNPQKFVDYNIKDVWLVQRIVEETGLIALILAMAYRAGVNYNDCFGTTRIWDTIIYRELRRNNMIVQPNKNRPKAPYPGGYVKDPMPGRHDWICSFDLNSLYPNIIVEYNMSPETLVEDQMLTLDVATCLKGEVPQTEYCVAANGSMYRKDKQGVLPKLIIAYYAERKEIQAKQKAKKIDLKNCRKRAERVKLQIEIAQLQSKQMSIKILMNSLYGALGNAYFRHYDLRMAEGITLSGQLTIQWAERTINDYMNKALGTNKDYVIAIDTDSNYVNMAGIVEKAKPKDPTDFLDKFCETVIEPQLEKSFATLGKQQNTYTPRMVMGREVIAVSGFWTKKKRYALLVTDDEGIRLDEPKLKIQGLEAIKSSTPMTVRGWLKETFMIILTKNEKALQDYIAKKRDEFGELQPEEIAQPAGVSKVAMYEDFDGGYVKGTPINSKAAIVYNNAVKRAGINKQYELISNGDKIKYLRLKIPNPTKEAVIGFIDVFPRELKLNRYIDYDLLFEKTYLKPMDPILNAIRWSAEEKNTLEGFFE